MSIRMRFTLVFNAIVLLTLTVFGVALYTVQARYTLDSLKEDLVQSSSMVARSVLRMLQFPQSLEFIEQPPPPPYRFELLASEPTFQELREREIVRVLGPDGSLVASPLSGEQEALPLTAEGLQALQSQEVWWETGSVDGERVLIYDRRLVVNGEVMLIVQAARQLTERDRSLVALGQTLVLATLLATLVAFGVGWALAGVTLRPIDRITQTAQEIGRESDFERRVEYTGPNDEIGRLATTFNAMLARLQEAYQHVSQALQMQRDLVGNVSHELRTPLTTVRGNLALLRRDPPLPSEEQVDVLSDLAEESDRLIELVNNLLILARADAGSSLVRQPFDLAPVVAEACQQVRQLDLGREIQERSEKVTALGDRGAVLQVLLILLDNALKYSRGVIRVTAEIHGQQALIVLQDEGPGIPAETQQRIFERFYRGEVAPEIPGFGLGLAIARALVEGQGGAITIQSQPGEGSTVRVFLPRVE